MLTSRLKFERGTVSYIITSTLTRPTNISPTSSCDRRVAFLDSIDIASLPPTKPRVITLEPISKRTRVKAKSKRTSLDRVREAGSIELAQQSTSSVSASNSTVEARPPLSPAPSEISSASIVSESARSFQSGTTALPSNGASARNSEVGSNTTSMSDKTIIATTELLRPGGLPGDTLPIKISISHTKPVKSLNGIIVTLYRQGRIDMHPLLPVGTTRKGKKPEYEDYYPKSRTGLGGLSLSSTSSSSLFRKDLSQSFAPLIIDPRTLTAIIKTSIRIPEDSFPTINRVPGGMISFKYYLEVIMDLRGKLAGQDRFIPRLNMTSAPTSYVPNGATFNVTDESGNQITSTWGGNVLDTTQIRREKSVVECSFEVIVGSRDSARVSRRVQEDSQSEEDFHSHDLGNEQREEDYQWSQSQYDDDGHYQQGAYGYDQQDLWFAPQPVDLHVPVQEGIVIPPPDPEEEVDEKTRLRRAEEFLLPSRPPEDDAAPSLFVPGPSAPVLDDGMYDTHGFHDHENGEASTPRFGASAPSIDTIVPPSTSHGSSNLPPSHDDQHSSQDDKQELERQRLMAMVSAPPADDDKDIEPGNSSQAFAPSAPVLTEEDEYSHLPAEASRAGEDLPQYQR